MKNAEYWQKRFTAVEAQMNRRGRSAVNEVAPAFDSAQKEIQKEIESWYQRFADNNGVTMVEARKMLTQKELEELKWDVNDYIKYGRENDVDQRWMKQLENASAKQHISRLEALQIRTQQAAEMAFGTEQTALVDCARDIYTEDYYHSAFEIQKGTGIGWDIGEIDNQRLDRIIQKPWTADGMTFSDKIWTAKDKLVSQVHTELTQMCILGKAPDEAIAKISKLCDGNKKQAGRLIMTESAYFASAAQTDCFKELDVEEYEIVATLDSQTSEICQQMDGQHFKLSEKKIGVNAPPFHPWCRTTTVPYFDDEWGREGTRAARGEDGKTYQVPSTMTYNDWKNQSVVGAESSKAKKKEEPKRVRQYNCDIATKLGTDHYDGMCEIIDKCPNKNLVNVWSNSEMDIHISNPNFKGHEYCSGNTIYVNAPKDSAGSSWQSPYQITFHESGHAIDHIYRHEGTGSGWHYSSKYKDGLFPKTIEDEVMEMVNAKDKELKQVFKTIDLTDVEELHKYNLIDDMDYGMWKRDGQLPWWSHLPTKYSKSMAYNAVQSEIQKLPQKAMCDLSDILEGATNGKIQCGFGHGKSYWSKRTIMGVKDGLATEAFAEMCDSSFANEESLNAIKKYLPKSYKVFCEMIDAIS